MNTIRKFNPGTLQSDDEVIRQFVVRHRELDILLDVLRANAGSPLCQHVLLVAPRGRGKTTLLARVAAELRTTELGRSLLPVRFMEESHEIFTLSDFWLEALFYLARELTTHNPGLSQELLKSRKDLVTRWRGSDLVDRARAIVLDAAALLGRQLVLMVENMQTLCKDADADFGWQLRATLQTDPQVILLATAISRFNGLDDASQPFFELFRVMCLQPLDTADCQTLWALAGGDAQRNVRPLQILTGGSPRLLVIVAEFARQHRSLRQLMHELVKLIDDHNEYFRGHLEALPKSERRVYVAALDLWQPSSTREIAERARMDVRTASVLIGRLVDRGALTTAGTGRQRRYAAAERLHNVYYKLRRERDEASVVRHLIHFMVTFYASEELGGFLSTLTRDAVVSSVVREGMQRAISDASLVSHAEVTKAYARATMAPADEIRVAVKEGLFNAAIETSDVFPSSAYTASRFPAATLAELASQIDVFVATCDDVVDRLGDDPTPELQAQVARAILRKGIMQRHAGKPEAAVATCNELVRRFENSTTLETRAAVAKALITKGLAYEQLYDVDSALATYDEVLEQFGAGATLEVQRPVAKALLRKIMVQARLKRYSATRRTCAALIERFVGTEEVELRIASAQALVAKAEAQKELGDAGAALATYQTVIERFDNESGPEFQAMVSNAAVGIAMLLDDTESTIAACGAVVDRLAANDAPAVRAAVAYALAMRAGYQCVAGRADEALSACNEIDQRCGGLGPDPDIPLKSCLCSLMLRTMALVMQGLSRDALEPFQLFYAAFAPEDVEKTRMLINLVEFMVTRGTPERGLVDILSSDAVKSHVLAPLIVALRERGGEAVWAPAEVREVAADVRAEIETRAEALRGAGRGKGERGIGGKRKEELVGG